MGLTDRLLQRGTQAPHVLLVPVPGAAPLRQAAEAWLDGRGWPRASSPADADVLLVCGRPGPDLSERAAVAWEGLPGPRARVDLTATDDVGVALLAARARLRDLDAQVADARERVQPRLSGVPDEESKADSEPSKDGMDMDGMDMGLPGGLAMADRAEDRDGLHLEGLRLQLGPVLPHWPAGVELDVVLSGEVLMQVRARLLDPVPEAPQATAPAALDALALLLDAAEWPDGARRARLARDEGGHGPATDDVLRRLRRARLLRWSLRGLPAPGGRDLVEHLDGLIAAVAEKGRPLPETSPVELGQALEGLDLGPATVVLAAYGPALTSVGAHV